MIQFRFYLFQTEFFFGEAAVFAADAVKFKSLFFVIAGDVAGFCIQTDAEGHAQFFVAHGFGKFGDFLEPGNVAVEGSFHIGSGLHDFQFFFRVGLPDFFFRYTGTVDAFCIAGMGGTVCAIGFHLNTSGFFSAFQSGSVILWRMWVSASSKISMTCWSSSE